MPTVWFASVQHKPRCTSPDAEMTGEHGYTNIMTSPWGIQLALEAVAGFVRNL